MKYIYILIYLLIIFLIINNIYSVDNFIWNNDVVLMSKIKQHLETVIIVHFIALTTISIIGLAMFSSRNKRNLLFLLPVFFLMLFIVTRLDLFFLKKENYFIWKYQMTTEEYNINMPKIEINLLNYTAKNH